MRFPTTFAASQLLAATVLISATTVAAAVPGRSLLASRDNGKIKPKVFIISMFTPEAEQWYGIPEFDVLANNITVPGFSPLFPDAHCTADGDICQLTTGESEINAAVTISSLVASPKFDLTTTYFLIAGIAGVNPEVATLGSVTFAKYAVQVALQYEFDQRDLPANYTWGYIPQGSDSPNEYPQSIYGTEVFEVNENLRDIPRRIKAIALASTASLNDSTTAAAYRKHYTPDTAYAAATKPPSVHACDVATSDVYYSGTILSSGFGNYTSLLTNGSGTYCTTAQEDNATLEALLRAALSPAAKAASGSTSATTGLVDFSRIIVMRTASDFDRPYPGQSAPDNLLYADQGGFEPAIQNIYLAGVRVVRGIVDGWASAQGLGVRVGFQGGVAPRNYIGDIFGSLGGEPDFGPGSQFGGLPATAAEVALARLVKRGGMGAGRRTSLIRKGVPLPRRDL
ncbi:MAG: hypothetical protein M1819_005232 [Sarea resinae]|nr:MAG: hypothetical protein M1819_005232 [Sarea resinae]